MAQVVKNLSADAGDLALIPGSRRSSGEGNGYSLQYSCLENMDRGFWRAIVHVVTKESDTHFCSDLYDFSPSANFFLNVSFFFQLF